jgi:hypothetical protein
VLKDHAVATFGVAPRDGARLVAHHVTRAAFEALLVIEQDPAIVGGHEQLGRARPYACLSRTAFTHLGVDGDVRLVRNAKVNGFHTIVEAQRSLRTLLQKVRYRHDYQLRAQLGIRRTCDGARKPPNPTTQPGGGSGWVVLAMQHR